MKKLIPLVVLNLSLLSAFVFADGAADNLLQNVRPIPPTGVVLPDGLKQPLLEQAKQLQKDAIAQAPKARLLPDVLIFGKAVEWALGFDELYDQKQLGVGEKLLSEGKARLESLRQGNSPWQKSGGLVARAYRSKLDRSIQPYGVVIPPTWKADDGKKWPLHIWFHGRGEKLTELDFLQQRMGSAGEFAPENAIVLHPYGRYCNGQRFAGEVDFLEALEEVKQQYNIDEERITVRGFSLGGAACWHIGAHYPSQWVAVNPGAGFSETEKFLNFFQGESLKPFPWERKLWNMYDSTAVPANFRNTNLIAYSGEADKQKQAADLMAVALEQEGMKLQHIIGAQAGHKYTPEAKFTVAAQLDTWQAAGRVRKFDQPLVFTTYTLRYPSCHWATVLGMEEHWSQARLTFTPPHAVVSKGVTEVMLNFPTDLKVTLDGQAATNGPWHKQGNQWVAGEAPAAGFRKRTGLQGPIDDAYMAPFLFVKPTGEFGSAKVKDWCLAEMARAEKEWRRQFRGEVRSKLDTEITSDEMKTYHLILWGDYQSNIIIKKMLAKLPFTWDKDKIVLGKNQLNAANHAPVMVYPNPVQPSRYIVINSGFTFREYDYLNNARQTSKLPDWALLDLDTPPNARFAGKVVAGDFFDEKWQIKPSSN